jgi:uncharacterized protein (TIGR02996 family)
VADLDSFLRAIIASPDDDTPRLVCADWLDEHGEPERAELIRVQCGLARLRYDDGRVSELQAREYRLLSGHLPAWREEYPYGRFHRGFLEELAYCRPEFFVGAGPTLFPRHPIRDVEIGSQEDPGWGQLVADCPHLARVEMLRLTKQRSHATDFTDFLAILASPHLTGLTALDASGGHGYGDDGLLTLLGVREGPLFGRRDAGPLPSLHNLRRLALNGMALTDRGVRALAESPLGQTLSHLDLSANEGITADGIRALIDSPLWSRLEELNLGRIYFRNGAAVRQVIGALPRSRITRLGLGGALFREARHLDLAEALATAPSWGRLEALDLSWCSLAGRGIDLLTECPHLAGLRWLNLANTRLTPRDAERLAGCPRLAGLTALRIQSHEMGDAQMKALAGSPHLGRLVYLSVDQSALGNAGVAAFARSPNVANLRVWMLPGSVGDTGLRAIARSPHLGRLTTLLFGGKVVTKGYRPPTDEGAEALARSTNLPNLAFIQHYWEGLSEAGLRALLGCERLAWHGWSQLCFNSPGLQQAYRERFKGFDGRDLILMDPQPLFPWATYAWT